MEPKSIGKASPPPRPAPALAKSEVKSAGVEQKPGKSGDPVESDLQERTMHLRGTVGAGKMTGRADKLRSDAEVIPASKDESLSQDLKASLRTAGVMRGLSGSVQSQALIGGASAEDRIDKHTSWGDLDEAGLGRELADKAKGDPAGGAREIDETLDELSDSDRDDVSLEVVENMSEDELAQMAKTEAGAKTLDRMRKDLDDGWTSDEEKAAMGKIDRAKTKAAQLKEEESLQRERDSSLRPDALHPSKAERMVEDGVRDYKTGPNTTRMSDDKFKLESPEQAKKAEAEMKAKQQAICDRMSTELKRDVANPPSMADTKEYFQKIAGDGGEADVERVQQELNEHLSAFYVHAGGGVDWGAKGQLANDLPEALAHQPRLKDGRQIIDCQGFSALTEHILGGIKDPKDPSGKTPMFDIMHAQTTGHIITGVFRHGDSSQGFVVDNDKVTEIPSSHAEAAREAAKNPRAEGPNVQRFVMLRVMGGQPSCKSRYEDLPDFSGLSDSN